MPNSLIRSIPKMPGLVSVLQTITGASTQVRVFPWMLTEIGMAYLPNVSIVDLPAPIKFMPSSGNFVTLVDFLISVKYALLMQETAAPVSNNQIEGSSFVTFILMKGRAL